MNNNNLEEVDFTEESQIQEQNIQINSDQIEEEKFSLYKQPQLQQKQNSAISVRAEATVIAKNN